MAELADAKALKAAAAHRGLKLVASRKRTPGVGDYGRFGLADAAGAPVLGIGPDGLTATVEEIARYLREGDVSTWAKSTTLTPDRVSRAAPVKEHVDEPASRRVSARRKKEPEPELRVRPAGAEDVAAICDLIALIGGVIDVPAVARRLDAWDMSVRPVLVAERGRILGCLAWQVVDTLQQGPIARITVVVVAEKSRRQGIGRMLVDRMLGDAAALGCACVEGLSPIDLRNVNGFFRALAFEQASYRFVRPP